MKDNKTARDSTRLDSLFKDAVKKLELDASRAGLTMQEVCKRARVGRASLWRYRTGDEVPKTVQAVSDMQRVVDEELEKKK